MAAFNERKPRPKLTQKRGGPAWKDIHPKLSKGTKRVAKKAYVVGVPAYVMTHVGRGAVRNGKVNVYGIGLRTAAASLATQAPFIAHAAYKKRKRGRKNG